MGPSTVRAKFHTGPQAIYLGNFNRGRHHLFLYFHNVDRSFIDLVKTPWGGGGRKSGLLRPNTDPKTWLIPVPLQRRQNITLAQYLICLLDFIQTTVLIRLELVQFLVAVLV